MASGKNELEDETLKILLRVGVFVCVLNCARLSLRVAEGFKQCESEGFPLLPHSNLFLLYD